MVSKSFMARNTPKTYQITLGTKIWNSTIVIYCGIKEYKIIVNPRCKNTLAELSAYVWDKSSPLGNTPRDSDNHLMDAMRYAFFDVKSFRPERVSAESGGVESGISRKDLLGGWSV